MPGRRREVPRAPPRTARCRDRSNDRARGVRRRVRTRCPPRVALAQRDAARKRPRLQFQRRQCHPQPRVVQDERLLADAGALAPADLIGKARARAVLETQHLEAQLPRAGDVGERLAGVLPGLKHAEALHERGGLHAVDGRHLDRRANPRRAGCAALRAALGAPVEQRLLRLDPGRFTQHRAKFAGGLQPIDAPHLGFELLSLGAVLVGVKMAAYARRARNGSCRRTAVRHPRRKTDIRQGPRAVRRPIPAADAPATVCAPITVCAAAASSCSGISRRNLDQKSRITRASPSARCRAAHVSPLRSITASRLCRGYSGNSRRESLTVHSTLAEKRHVGLEKLAAQERIVETRVVRHEHRAVQLVAHRGRDSAKRGASATISLLMPVKFSMYAGMGHSGFTSELHSSTSSPFFTRTMPTSVIRSYAALPPVVSKSTNTRSCGRSSAAAIER